MNDNLMNSGIHEKRMKYQSFVRAFAFLMLIALMTSIFVCTHVYGAGWTTTEIVSTESTEGSSNPSLGVGPDGTVHIAWEDWTNFDDSAVDKNIFYKRFVPGTGWTTTEVVSTESTRWPEDPSLAVGPDGTVHIAWERINSPVGSTDYDIFYKRFVPGTGWTTTELVSPESTGAWSFKPSLAVGPDGTVHIAWEEGVDIMYRRFVPGTGWTATEVVSTESTDNSFEPSLAVDPDGTVHIAWADSTRYTGPKTTPHIFYKKYVPGTGWTTTEVVSTESNWTSSNPSLAVGSDGTVHIAWQDLWGAKLEILYKRFVPGTGWTTTEVVSTESKEACREPSLAVGPDGTVHIAWQEDIETTDLLSDVDIWYRRFVPGTGWSTTEIISTESFSDSECPSLGVGPDGTVHIAWHDWTNIGGWANNDVDIFYKSLDMSAVTNGEEEKPAESEPTETEPTESAEAPLITTEIVIIAAVIVVAVIGIVSYWMLRKRK